MITKNVSLKKLNTFGLDCTAALFTTISNISDLKSIWKSNLLDREKLLILGGGSNILLLQNFPGLVIKNEIKGKKIIQETAEYVWVEFGAGEIWHECVLWAIDHGFGGLENMSLIPGTIGAAPMQNIGAYGVELKSVFENLQAFHLKTGNIETFNKAVCQFGYRESIFKHSHKNQYFIFSVTLKLSKQPKLNMAYGDIQQTLTEKNIDKPDIKEISDAVIAIRRSKLPDPDVLGNSGSFFKNPVIDQRQAALLQKTYPDLKTYEAENGVKIPAGWLIEKAGWKGQRLGNVGMHEKQALVLVNYGEASGLELWKHAEKVIASVKETFGIELQAEVNLIG